MKVGLYARERHHLDHIVPVYLALPDAVRGKVMVPRPLVARARDAGIDAVTVVADNQVAAVAATQITIVSAWGSLKELGGAPAVFMEHGSGQTFADDGGRNHVSYAGAARRPGVRLFLCPNDRVAAANRATHPHIPAVTVGTPYLDVWHTAPKRPMPDVPTVAVSFHWECLHSPEAMSAWTHYRAWFSTWAADPTFHLIGHAHPKIADKLAAEWADAGVEFVAEWTDVMARADIYAVDESSTMYEFASLDRPVIAMNAPWYRRSMHHGLRFWEFIPGPQIGDGAELSETVAWVRRDPLEVRRVREYVNDHIVPVRDGTSAAQAAAAIVEHVA